MNSVTFSSKSKEKLDLLIRLAKEMGIKAEPDFELTDEDMAMPGHVVSREQLNKWLEKEDGESYSSEEMQFIVKEELSKFRAKRKK